MADTKENVIYRASTTAPVNIAVIKSVSQIPIDTQKLSTSNHSLTTQPTRRYWGKRDPVLNLPTNSSLSVTLSQRSLRTHTTASCSPTYPPSTGDTLLLNNHPEPIQSSKRTLACLSSLRSLRAALESVDPSLPPLSTYPLRLVSSNNFPTAAGLASSAAGFAALVRAVADLYALPQTPEQLSLIARQGSGSACRSLMGGYVAWRAGSREDGLDSLAAEVAPVEHWSEMRALVLVVSAAKKSVASTAGMQVTVQTSPLHKYRVEAVVERAMAAMEKAIHEKDFERFAEETMRDSNSFHAVCLDSWPPIHYLNDVSRAAMKVVAAINERAGKVVAAYTFDAGPNAVIYYLEENGDKVAGQFRGILGEEVEGWTGEFAEKVPKGEVEKGLDEGAVELLKTGVSRVICTGVGGGPVKVEDHLVDEKGAPVNV